MATFKISDIRELFTKDVEQFHKLTQHHVEQLLTQTPPPAESLSEALRHVHTLKGLAATVQAWGLSCLGTDYEQLLTAAGSWMNNERSKANEVFSFIRAHEQEWFIMNHFTCRDMLSQAWDTYLNVRWGMEERWPGYLLAIERAAVTAHQAAAVRLPNRDQADAQPSAKPAAPSALNVVPPRLRSQNETTAATASDRDVRPAVLPSSSPAQSEAAPAKPQPLSVVPPTLRRANDANLSSNISTDLKPAVPATTGPVERSMTTDASVNPGTSPASASNAAATPPLLRVAPPTLKRRAEAELAPAAPIVTDQGEIDAEALFANCLATPEAKPEFQATADSDLLELLGQEVAGYLTELESSLTSLAANLANETAWDKTRRLFHTIKGTAATFNLEAVSAPAKTAEARCIIATEDANARTIEAFELCVQRAQVIATALNQPFNEEPLRTALSERLTGEAAADTVTETAAPVDAEMADFFIRDARDQIEVIEKAVLRWEKGEAALDQVHAAQRGFHTLKGAGNSIGFTAVAKSVHDVEAFLENVAAAGGAGSKPLFTFLLDAVDQLRRYLAELTKNPATPWRHDWSKTLQTIGTIAAQPTPLVIPHDNPEGATSFITAPVDEDSQSLRVDSNRLYELMNLMGEMVVNRAKLERKIEQLTSLHRVLGERNQALSQQVQAFQQQFEFNLLKGRKHEPNAKASPTNSNAPHSEFSELEFDRYDQFNILARSLTEISHDIEQLQSDVTGCLDSFEVDNQQFKHASQLLQINLSNLSLVPVRTLFPRLRRAFRDALNVECKEADLVLQGGEARLDKVVVDKIYAPLLHLLRNSVAHGIEDTAGREQNRKSARGQVRFLAEQAANQIVIQISDDGAGINADAVRRRAIQKGWLAADAPTLTAEQVAHFIFQPGFSTAKKVTSVSGRGIGLDVVRAEIEALNGSVELKFEPGQGSTWTLRLPLTLSISEAILGEVGGSQFALPMSFIESGIILDSPTTCDDSGRELYLLGDRTLPVLRLGNLLQLPNNADAKNGLILAIGDRRAILIADTVLARQEIVVKKLDSITMQHPLLNGATVDAEGRVLPILNLPAILKFGEQAVRRPAPVARRANEVDAGKLRVLVVDDSLSVRKVQERMLAELNCVVTTAADGLYALEKLREGEFDLIFTDLEMPRLNGYELISDLRGNPTWAKLPVIVISSRGADKYITKAMDLGASTFLCKPFTQEQLQQVLDHYGKASGRVPAPAVA